jgi:hypothetical protein
VNGRRLAGALGIGLVALVTLVATGSPPQDLVAGGAALGFLGMVLAVVSPDSAP